MTRVVDRPAADERARSTLPTEFECLGVERAHDVATRREVKYALPGADVGSLRSVLRGACRRVEHGGPSSIVRSIYFDDLPMTSYWENAIGTGQRNKVRLRWYGGGAAPDEFFFEIKWRRNNANGKHRERIRAPRPLAELSFGEITSGLAGVLSPDFAELLLRRPEPIAVVEYRREYFESHCGTLRATLDYDLTFYDQTLERRPRCRVGVAAPGLVVLEGKTPVGQESRLRDLFYPLQPRATRSSKYVLACQRLGMRQPT